MGAVTSLGLGKTMEKKLHSVGIHSAEELTKYDGRVVDDFVALSEMLECI